MSRTSTLASIVAVVGLALTGNASAITLGVDAGLTGQDVQTGFEEFSGPSSAAASQSATYTSGLGNAGAVSVAVTSVDGTLNFRDRSDVTHPLGDVLEDFVFNQGVSSTRLDLALDGLMPGSYTVTTYHHDSDHTWHHIGVRVTDALGSERGVATGVDITTGTTPTSVGSATFSVFSDGVNPVTLHMDEETTLHVMLNGLTVTDQEALRVDFAYENPSNPGLHDVQNGFLPFARTTSTTTGTQWEDFSASFGTGGTVRLLLDAPGESPNQLHWRDRGDMHASVELGDMAEDFVFDHDHMSLRLRGLMAGTYVMTSYHHDTTHVVSYLDIEVSDAKGSNRQVVTDLSQKVSSTVDPACATYLLYANGTDDITIDFIDTGLPSDGVARLNGLALSYIPEPASLTLLALGGLGLLIRRRRTR